MVQILILGFCWVLSFQRVKSFHLVQKVASDNDMDPSLGLSLKSDPDPKQTKNRSNSVAMH